MRFVNRRVGIVVAVAAGLGVAGLLLWTENFPRCILHDDKLPLPGALEHLTVTVQSSSDTYPLHSPLGFELFLTNRGSKPVTIYHAEPVFCMRFFDERGKLVGEAPSVRIDVLARKTLQPGEAVGESFSVTPGEPYLRIRGLPVANLTPLTKPGRFQVHAEANIGLADPAHLGVNPKISWFLLLSPPVWINIGRD